MSAPDGGLVYSNAFDLVRLVDGEGQPLASGNLVECVCAGLYRGPPQRGGVQPAPPQRKPSGAGSASAFGTKAPQATHRTSFASAGGGGTGDAAEALADEAAPGPRTSFSARRMSSAATMTMASSSRSFSMAVAGKGCAQAN